jgi:lactoylglutathione lyase
MRASGLHHVGVHVADLESSVAFYEEVFGLEVAARLELGDERLVFLNAGAQSLELIADARGRRQTGVVDHLALAVDNLDDWFHFLRERGVRVLDPQPLDVPPIAARILFCLGPDDERIELFEQRSPA